MNADDDVQTQILREIWNEMKALNSRVDKTNAELARTRDDLTGKIDELRVDLTTKIEVETRGLRTATQSGFETLARADRGRDGDLDELRSRVDRIEQHVGLR